MSESIERRYGIEPVWLRSGLLLIACGAALWLLRRDLVGIHELWPMLLVAWGIDALFRQPRGAAWLLFCGLFLQLYYLDVDLLPAVLIALGIMITARSLADHAGAEPQENDDG
ncbi:MAG: hypothetical protein D6696_00580 [Acidobacteria bacterium]|nr:MAG: hypothetical protein D6696_00580 [Acidobacteriota bacterium]